VVEVALVLVTEGAPPKTARCERNVENQVSGPALLAFPIPGQLGATSTTLLVKGVTPVSLQPLAASPVNWLASAAPGERLCLRAKLAFL
jgi:hypothetical protein